MGGVANVLMMITANLVGFAVGLDGLESIVKGIFRDYSGMFFFFSFLFSPSLLFSFVFFRPSVRNELVTD